jgi:hypothetical protein
VQGAQSSIEHLTSENAGLKEKLEHLYKERERKPERQNLGELAKIAAMAASGDDPEFIKVVEGEPLLQMFPVQITKKLEAALRRRLGRLGAAGFQMSLFDLLSEARDANSLPEEAIDLAHTIRKQRNIIAHFDVDSTTTPARTLLVLFAASVLWPYLTQWPEGGDTN